MFFKTGDKVIGKKGTGYCLRTIAGFDEEGYFTSKEFPEFRRLIDFQLYKPMKRFVLSGRNEYNGALQYFCFNTELRYNRHGNLYVDLNQEKRNPSFIPFFESTRYVFSRSGVCISHPPSKKYRYTKVNAELLDVT